MGGAPGCWFLLWIKYCLLFHESIYMCTKKSLNGCGKSKLNGMCQKVHIKHKMDIIIFIQCGNFMSWSTDFFHWNQVPKLCPCWIIDFLRVQHGQPYLSCSEINIDLTLYKVVNSSIHAFTPQLLCQQQGSSSITSISWYCMIYRHPHRENVENTWAISLPIVTM